MTTTKADAKPTILEQVETISVYTEEQHKTLWCAHARTMMIVTIQGREQPVPISFNRQVMVTDNGEARMTGAQLCLGRGCASWRWHDMPVEVKIVPTQGWPKEEMDLKASGYRPASEPYSTDYAGTRIEVRQWARKMENRRGYCGLAGKP